MNVWDIILIGLIIAAVLWFAVSSVISRVRAKKAGIIRVKRPAKIDVFVCNTVCAVLGAVMTVSGIAPCVKQKKTIDDLERLGFVQFHMEYYNWGVKNPVSPEIEQSATEKLLSKYREEYDRERNLTEARALLAVIFAVAAFFNGAYITKKGVYMFGDIKPRNTAAKVEDGQLCFNSRGKLECTMLKLPATEENLRLYSEFMTEEKI